MVFRRCTLKSAVVEPIYGDLPDNWRMVSLGELIDAGFANLQTGPFGTMLHASAYRPTGTPVVAVLNIGENRLKYEDIPRIDEETAQRLDKYRLKQNDILFGRKGTVDRRALIRANEKDWLQGSDCIRLRFNGEVVLPQFVSYVLGSDTYRQWVIRHAHGATMPSLNQDILRLMPLPLPPLPEQHAIAAILGTLDDKIELNRRMNRTLEEMARALFKSWFVDFEPVRAKMEGRDTGLPPHLAELFPARFQDSALGEVPEGWEVKPLPEAIAVNPFRSLAKGQIAPYLDMQNMPTDNHRAIRWTERSFGSGTKFINGDTLLARITPCLENGKTAFVDFLSEGQVGWGSTEYIILRPNLPLPVEFGYYLARSDNLRDHTIQNMTGTSGRQRVPPSCLAQYLIAMPSEPVAHQFGKFAQSTMAVIRANDEQSRTLAAIRDALLPRLMSGALWVQEAEAIVSHAV